MKHRVRRGPDQRKGSIRHQRRGSEQTPPLSENDLRAFNLAHVLFQSCFSISRETAIGLIFSNRRDQRQNLERDFPDGPAGSAGFPGTKSLSGFILITFSIMSICSAMDRSDLRFYYGFGGRFHFRGRHSASALRFPFGLDLIAAGRHAGFFIEGVPVVSVQSQISSFYSGRSGTSIRVLTFRPRQHSDGQ